MKQYTTHWVAQRWPTPLWDTMRQISSSSSAKAIGLQIGHNSDHSRAIKMAVKCDLDNIQMIANCIALTKLCYCALFAIQNNTMGVDCHLGGKTPVQCIYVIQLIEHNENKLLRL